MCGCERHHHMTSRCTCTCPSHAEIRAEQERSSQPEREWKPGDVARLTWDNACGADKARGIRRRTTKIGVRYADGWVFGRYQRLTDEQIAEDPDDFNLVIEPVLVIGADDTKLAKRLDEAYAKALVTSKQYESTADCMANAVRALLAPPKQQVYEHLAVSDSDTCQSLCGKVWKPALPDAVEVMGKCPECREIAENGWIS